MNLQQLTYFVAIARERNFTRAANACFVAQPALSQQVRKLEEELGARLLDRSRRGIELTGPGIEFLAYAERILQLLSEGKQRIVDMREFRFGVVSLMCTPTVATYWLPRVIQQYRALYPKVEIRIIEQSGCTPDDLYQTMADLGVVQIAEGSKRRAARPVEVERLFRDELVLVCPANHPLAAPAGDAVPISLASLANEAFVLAKAPCGMTRVVAKAFADAGIQPRVTLETSQVEAVCEMVAAGLGVGFMPRMAMHREYPGVVWRPLARPTPSRTIGLATFSDRTPSAVVAAFIDIARTAAAESRRRSPHSAPLQAVA